MKNAIKINKKLWLCLGALVLAVLIGVCWYQNTHVFVEGTAYPKDAQSLDLRGTGISASHYGQLKQLLPGCRIDWDVPFQGGYLPEDTREVAISSLSEEDLDMLGYLPSLESVDATGCTDYDNLMALKERYPHIRLRYDVFIGGKAYPHITAKMAFDGDEPAAEELLEKLRYLPKMTAIHFTQPQTAAQDLTALRQKYPGITITWEKDVLGQTFGDDVKELDFSGTLLTGVEELEELMGYFPELEKLILSDCGLDYEYLAQYRDRVREHYKVVWTVVCGRFSIRTDAETIMSYKYNLFDLQDKELVNLKYCEDMICVDLGHNYLRSCDWAAYMPKLKYLILAHNNGLRDISGLANCKELVYLEIGWTALRDLTPLLGCTKLEDINMKYVFCDADVIVQMPWLKNVFWTACPSRNYEMLEGALPDTYLLLTDEFWNTKHWRQLDNYYAQRDALGMYYMN